MASSTKTPAHSSVTRLKSSFLAKKMSDEEFYQLCRENEHLKIERSADQEIIIMLPSVTRISQFNNKLNYYLTDWNEKHKPGYVFESSAGFKFPNGAFRAPDVSWIQKDRWHQLSANEQNSFAPIAPDFVAKLMSKWDDWGLLQEKMAEYIENGVRLGWLINADEEVVIVYQKDGTTTRLEGKNTVLDGESVLPGFEITLKQIFEE